MVKAKGQKLLSSYGPKPLVPKPSCPNPNQVPIRSKPNKSQGD